MSRVRADDERMTIGALARATGLTPSALRFYDECDLITPDSVDPATGYRYYSPDQVARVTAVRHLRAAGLPLDGVRRVLSATSSDAADQVASHLRDLEQRLADAKAQARVALDLLHAAPGTAVRGALLADAVRRVALVAAPHGTVPVLSGILLEVDDELRLVATDRYRMSVRSLPTTGSPRSGSVVVPADELVPAVGRLEHDESVVLTIDAGRLTLAGTDGTTTALPGIGSDYPDYRAVLSSTGPIRTTVTVAQVQLAQALDDAEAGPVALRLDTGFVLRPSGADAEALELPADVRGDAIVVHVDPGTFAPAIRGAVGPDVLLGISAADRPITIRSVDDGDLLTLAMPVAAPLAPGSAA